MKSLKSLKKFSKKHEQHGVWPYLVFLEYELDCYIGFDKMRGRSSDGPSTKEYREKVRIAREVAEQSGIPRCSEYFDSPFEKDVYGQPKRYQCECHEGHSLKNQYYKVVMHRNMAKSWEKGWEEDYFSPKPVSTKEIGDEQENELLERLLLVYPKMVKTNVNAIGVDLQYSPDVDVQSKAHRSVGPQKVSHFADSSEALLKIMVGLTFTKEAKSRALKRGVTLLTLKEFRRRYPLPKDVL